MEMKNFLMIVAKNALNAVLTNGALVLMIHDQFNVYSGHGWYNIGKATLAVVAAREGAVWGPVLLKWSTTDANPNGNEPKA